MTPTQAGELTPVEVQTMLEGMDWQSDRDWERALAGGLSGKAAFTWFESHYPRFRATTLAAAKPRVKATIIKSSEDTRWQTRQ